MSGTFFPSSPIDQIEDDCESTIIPVLPEFDMPLDRASMKSLPIADWLIPGHPDSQLNNLLHSAIELARSNKDECFNKYGEFCKDGLLSSFRHTFELKKIFYSDTSFLHSIYSSALLAVELCALLAADDFLPILELEAIVFDPLIRFHLQATRAKASLTEIRFGVPSNPNLVPDRLKQLLPHLLPESSPQSDRKSPNLKIFAAAPSSARLPLLEDFINLFGRLGGFDRLLERFASPNSLEDMDLEMIIHYIYPFSMCSEYLESTMLEEYFGPVVDAVSNRLSASIDRVPGKPGDSVWDILKHLTHYLRCLARRLPSQPSLLLRMDTLYLSLIHRNLQLMSFNSRMAALNDLKTLLVSLTNPPDPLLDDDPKTCVQNPLTVTLVADWMHDKQILQLALRENLHQHQYVERVERVIHFMALHGHLTTEDLDEIWQAQDGKHEVITKNVFDMLARLAFDFSPEQLEHLFHRFQESWTHATKFQRDHLLELISRLAEEDRDGLMAEKVLDLLWELATDTSSLGDVSDSALKAHAKILDHNSSGIGGAIRCQWISRLVEMLKEGPRKQPLLHYAIKQLGDICTMITSSSTRVVYRSGQLRSRDIQALNMRYNLLEVTITCVAECMTVIREKRARTAAAADKTPSPKPDVMHPASLQSGVQKLLKLIRYLLTEGLLTFHLTHVRLLWNSFMTDVESDRSDLVFTEDRELCFRWFASLSPDTIQTMDFFTFFEEQLLRVEPVHMTPSGMNLFQLFFFRVNAALGHLIHVTECSSPDLNNAHEEVSTYVLDDPDLNGLTHVWRMLLHAPNAVAMQAVQLIEQLYTNLTDQLSARQLELYEDVLKRGFSLLVADYHTVCALHHKSLTDKSEMNQTINRTLLLIQLLQRFLLRKNHTVACGWSSFDEPMPLKRCWIGSSILFTVLFDIPSYDPRTLHHLLWPDLPQTKWHEYCLCPLAKLPYPNAFLFACHANMTTAELERALRRFYFHMLSLSLDKQSMDSVGQINEFTLRLCVHSHAGKFPCSNANVINTSEPGHPVCSVLPLWSDWPVGFMLEHGVNTTLCQCKDDWSVLHLQATVSWQAPSGTWNKPATTSKPLPESTAPSLKFPSSSDCPKSDPPTSLLTSPGLAEVHKNDEKNDFKLTSMEERSKFLLKLAAFCLELDNLPCFLRVLDLLLCLPPRSSLVERLRLDVLSSARLAMSEHTRQDLHDWVTVSAPHTSPLSSTYLGKLLINPVYHSDSVQDKLSHIMSLYYTIQVLYSLCLPSAAILESFSLLSSDKPDVPGKMAQADLHSMPWWLKAGSFTLQLLRAGAIPVLLSCPLLSESQLELPTEGSTYNVLLKLSRVWLVRLLRLLLIVTAFTIVGLARSQNPCSNELRELGSRVSPLCESLKSTTNRNEPVLGGSFYLVLHATWVGRLAVTSGVTLEELQQHWLAFDAEIHPADFILHLACLYTEVEESVRHLDDTLPATLSDNGAVTEPQGQELSCLAEQATPSHEALRCLTLFIHGNNHGALWMEALACVPFLSVLFPRSNTLTTSWIGPMQRLLFSSSTVVRHAALFVCCHLVVGIPKTQVPETEVHPVVQHFRTFLSSQSSLVGAHPGRCEQYFRLLALLLQHIRGNQIPFDDANSLLIDEVSWLRAHFADRKSPINGSSSTPDRTPRSLSSSPLTECTSSAGSNTADSSHTVFEGHMRLCCALLVFPGPDEVDGGTQFEKTQLAPLMMDLLHRFLFPGHEQQDVTLFLSRSGSLPDTTLASAFELLWALAARGPFSMQRLTRELTQLAFPADVDLSTYPWDYTPPAILHYSSPKSAKQPHFVGLKNAGATCYMNAILQQLFTLTPICDTILSARPETMLPMDDPCNNELSGLSNPSASSKSSVEQTPINSPSTTTPGVSVNTENSPPPRKPLTSEQAHQLRLLYHLQTLFGHLKHSLLKSYEPVEFWQEFKFSSEQVKLSEQHDALEFLQTLGSDVDESLHLCGLPKIVEQVLGGTFADQKLCIDCPHRYSRNEPFTTLNLDIHNHQNLLQSLAQYVKGDRLEGDNAYWCEACDKKVTTLKRMCVDRLPLVLAIQLKRFYYDWDRGVAMKFDDYFEFPRELDMYPYTVKGLGDQLPDTMTSSAVGASAETIIIPPEEAVAAEVKPAVCTRYSLRGVVVHSGRASAGHYYSYIRHYCPKSKIYKWYKYDDNTVSPAPMNDDNEAKRAWFGGDASTSSDKRSEYLRLWNMDRFWSAYILFYEREDFESQLAQAPDKELAITPRMKSKVNRENIRYLHQQMLFHPLLARFIARTTQITLDMCRLEPTLSEHVGLTTLRLVLNFSFAVRFQNVASDWQRWIPLFFKLVSLSPLTCEKFVQWSLLGSPDRLCELLFECPYPEVRFMFGFFIVYIASQESSAKCQPLDRYLSAFYAARRPPPQKTTTVKFPPNPEDNAMVAREKSAREVVLSQCCSQDCSPPCAQPSLADVLLKTLILQLRASPAEFLCDEVDKSFTKLSEDEMCYETESFLLSCGSSYSKSRRFLSLYPHPIVWKQYFSIFLDYAHSGRAAVRRLLKLGVAEELCGAFMRTQYSFSQTTTLAHQSSNIHLSDTRNLTLYRGKLNEALTVITDNVVPPSSCVDSLLLTLLHSDTTGNTNLYGSGDHASNATVKYSAALSFWSLLSLLIRSTDASDYCCESPESVENGDDTTASSGETNGSARTDTSPVKRNPYSTFPTPLCPMSSTLADMLLLRNSSTQFVSFFLRPWVNGLTVKPIAETIMFLSFENIDFSSIALECLVWSFKNGHLDFVFILYLIQSLLTIRDSFKLDRLRFALTGADRTGLAVPPLAATSHHYHYPQTFTRYAHMIKMFVALVLNDANIRQYFQQSDHALDWLHRGVDSVMESMRLSSPVAHSIWGNEDKQAMEEHDTFIRMVQQLYNVLPLSDEESTETEGSTECVDTDDPLVQPPPQQQPSGPDHDNA